MSHRRKPTYKDLVQSLAKLLTESEDETPEEVDENLRNAGYDPDELVVRMRQRIKQMIDNIKDQP